MYILKYYARIGLAFSTTKHVLKIPPENIVEIDDIEKPYKNLEGEDKIHIFTDGCGNIS